MKKNIRYAIYGESRRSAFATLVVLVAAILTAPSTVLAATILSQSDYSSLSGITRGAGDTIVQSIDCGALNATISSIELKLQKSANNSANTHIEFVGKTSDTVLVLGDSATTYTYTFASPPVCVSGSQNLTVVHEDADDVYYWGSSGDAYTLGSLTCGAGGCGLYTQPSDLALVLYGTVNSTPPPPPPTPTPAPAPAASSGPVDGTINVVKTVVNDNGGTSVFSDFPLFVNGTLVFSGITNRFPAPASVYAVTETSASNYVQAFSGDCDGGGRLNLNPGENKFCIITNDDIGPPVVVPPIPPLIDVVNVPNPLALPTGSGSATYVYTLKNIGTVPVTNVTMVGDTCSPVVLSSGDTNGDSKLDVNETWVYLCTTTLSETHTNTIVATGWANGISAVDIASATVVVGLPVLPPLIHVTKVPSPLALVAGGGAVTYTNMVSNPGAVALQNVHVEDDKCSPVTYVSGDTNGDGKLDVNETWVYNCQAYLNKTTTNTVTADAGANGLIAKDFAIATVVVASTPGLPNTGASSAYFGEQVRTIAVSLGRGSSGSNVAILQQFLISQNKGPAALALANVGPTAYFGLLTKAALAEFQVKVGVNPPLGYFGPITRGYVGTHY